MLAVERAGTRIGVAVAVRRRGSYPRAVPKRWLIGFALLLACTGSREREPAPAAQPAAVNESQAEPERAPLVTVELVLVGPEARALLEKRLGPSSPLVGAEQLLAVHHRIAAPWHIYWLNPGDSGLRTRLSFDATGVEIGSVAYPGPDRFVASGGQVSYGWEREAMLFVPLNNIADDASVGVRSDWLACHESCIPGHSQASASIGELVAGDQAIVRSMIERIPEPAGERLFSSWTDHELRLEPVGSEGLIEFFPYASEPAVLQDTSLNAGALELSYRFDGPPPAELGQGVVLIDSAGESRYWELAIPWP